MVEILLQFALPTVVAGLIAGAFGLANKRRDARNETEQKTLPTWTEAMKENRELRAELKSFRADFETYKDEAEKEAAEYKKQTSEEIKTLRDAFERQMGATRRVLRDVARQWVSPLPPVLHPDDVAVLSDTLPAAWRAS